MKQTFLTFFFVFLSISVFGQMAAPRKEFYEIREYELRFGSPVSNLENYFKNALIPALNRLGVKNVGVFKEIGKSEPAKIYVLIPYSSIEQYANISVQIKSDDKFKEASQEYNSLLPDKAPYFRYTTSLLMAFDGLPQMIKPNVEQRFFEMRTYESFSEDAARRKIKMFNEEEIKIFYQTKLNPVFFGEVIAGEHQPCLTYMLTFKNMEERDANWKAFSADADWKRISPLPEYANTVSRIIRVFLEPTTYSQI
ncbi:NIPSNAP family protein [Emticicia agri]|uniref:NIPSNAP family containing protein n=1 Tax=Emticicia agri TaxID=2492393 RepID=A0A4Q5M2W7_9BACT|nr:NIPSNAP family protein [Emticicia agri]RYU96187.1 NIPSNAP family containing protein [Emticicia agri]